MIDLPVGSHVWTDTPSFAFLPCPEPRSPGKPRIDMPQPVRFVRLDSNPDLPLPHRATDQAAGYDVRSAEPDFVLEPGDIRLVSTGLIMELPAGIECQVRPRSGLAVKHGVTLPNTPGTIDPDYRGEVKVPLINLGREPVEITRGTRVAQLVFARFEVLEPVEAEAVSETDRGEGGFGSTGTA